MSGYLLCTQSQVVNSYKYLILALFAVLNDETVKYLKKPTEYVYFYVLFKIGTDSNLNKIISGMFCMQEGAVPPLLFSKILFLNLSFTY